MQLNYLVLCIILVNEKTRGEITSLWLSRLLTKLGDNVVNAEGCKKELSKFVSRMYIGCGGMPFKDAWQVFSCTSQCDTFPNMVRLWQAILVLPISSVACERGFSKQNLIKSNRRQCLKVETLEALMRVSLLGPPDSTCIEWEEVYKIWELVKARRTCQV